MSVCSLFPTFCLLSLNQIHIFITFNGLTTPTKQQYTTVQKRLFYHDFSKYRTSADVVKTLFFYLRALTSATPTWSRYPRQTLLSIITETSWSSCITHKTLRENQDGNQGLTEDCLISLLASPQVYPQCMTHLFTEIPHWPWLSR